MISDLSISVYLVLSLVGIFLLTYRVSFALQKQWLVSVVRATAQLSLLGFVLTPIMESKNWLILVMILITLNVSAAFVTLERTRRKNKIYGPVFISLFFGTLIFGLVVFLLTSSSTQHQTRYIFPFMGVLLSNSISGVSLAIKSLFQLIESKREEIESYVLMGFRPQQMLKKYQAELLDLALTPSLNAMASAGLVGVPGVMAGALMAGQSFKGAVVSQIHIFVTLSLSVFITASLSLYLIVKKLYLFGSKTQSLQAKGLKDASV